MYNIKPSGLFTAGWSGPWRSLWEWAEWWWRARRSEDTEQSTVRLTFCHQNWKQPQPYLRLQYGLVRAPSPTKEEEDEDESEEDVEHDDQGEQGVGYERQAAIPVVGRKGVVGLLQPGQGGVVDQRVRQDDVHGYVWCCSLQPPATSVLFPLSQSTGPTPHPSLHPPRHKLNTEQPAWWNTGFVLSSRS